VRFQKTLLTVCLISTLAGSCFAQSHIQSKHARIEFLSQPARDGALMGIHFILEKGWHIYWINPGDSGQPPTLHWTLPTGATAGEIQWPQPERLQTSPTIADYGYKDDVLLLVPLRLPGKNTMAEIALDAKWLICREVCLPDHAHLTLSPAAASAGNRTRVAQLFTRTKALLPRTWPATWKVNAESRKDDFVLIIITGHPLTQAEFFPLETGLIDNAAKQRLSTTSTGAKLMLQKSDLLLKPVPELRGVLVINHRAYHLLAPVIAQVALKYWL
jgi:DsbC/DsbD-like thiol-disulfide interchange protein